MGARSRAKGRRAEQEIVRLAQSLGLSASREWQNAQHDDPAVRAVDVTVAGRPAQVKRAAAGHKALYDALAGVDFLFVRTDNKPWLVVLDAEKLLAMLSKLNVGNVAQSHMTRKRLGTRRGPVPNGNSSPVEKGADNGVA